MTVIEIPEYHIESFKDHVLVRVVDHPKVQIYTMRRPGTGTYRVQLTFTIEGIVIQGDCVFDAPHGTISSWDYGMEWFSGRLDSDYLCEKFLTKRYVPELAAKQLQYELDNPDDYDITDEQKDGLTAIIRELKQSHMPTQDELVTDLDFIEYNDDYDYGWGYDPGSAAILCVVQQTFQRLMMARKELEA